ncbi:MAG: TadE/TadG family type IV pilus assembly protein [Candidatus Limnocylindrales bacterium]
MNSSRLAWAASGARRLRAADRHGPRHHRSRGQALVELALVTPILLLLLLGAVDLGRLFYARITVTNAAREGAMMAADSPTSWSAGGVCSSSNKVMCAALRESNGSWVTVAAADVSLTCSPSCAKSYGTTVNVTVTGHFSLLTPLLWVFTGGQNVTFQESAVADVVILPEAAGVPTPTPSPTPSPTAEPTPSPDPSASVEPSAAPTAEPTPSPTPACPAPLVGFSTSQPADKAPVSFTSTSGPTTGTCAISYWRWEFGDLTTSAGNLPSTSHDYGSPKGRTFNVTLTVTTPGGTYSYTRAITTLK